MFLVTALYGDGTVKSHLAARAREPSVYFMQIPLSDFERLV